MGQGQGYGPGSWVALGSKPTHLQAVTSDPSPSVPGLPFLPTVRGGMAGEGQKNSHFFFLL